MRSTSGPLPNIRFSKRYATVSSFSRICSPAVRLASVQPDLQYCFCLSNQTCNLVSPFDRICDSAAHPGCCLAAVVPLHDSRCHIASRLQLCLAGDKSLLGVNSVRLASYVLKPDADCGRGRLVPRFRLASRSAASAGTPHGRNAFGWLHFGLHRRRTSALRPQ